MILALLLAAAAPQKAIDAERAFAAAAAREGQWTAFRRYAAPSAIMFVPQPTNAQAWLKDRKDPPRSVEWWLIESFASCDGRTVANHGGWRQPDGTVGFFSTIWQRQRDGGWKWVVDGGDALKTPLARPAKPKVVTASCKTIVPKNHDAGRQTDSGGVSVDGTLAWEWTFNSSGDLRTFGAYLWTGDTFVDVIDDYITVK